MHQKKFKTTKNPILFKSENCIFGSFNLFSGADEEFETYDEPYSEPEDGNDNLNDDTKGKKM